MVYYHEDGSVSSQPSPHEESVFESKIKKACKSLGLRFEFKLYSYEDDLDGIVNGEVFSVFYDEEQSISIDCEDEREYFSLDQSFYSQLQGWKYFDKKVSISKDINLIASSIEEFIEASKKWLSAEKAANSNFSSIASQVSSEWSKALNVKPGSSLEVVKKLGDSLIGISFQEGIDISLKNISPEKASQILKVLVSE